VKDYVMKDYLGDGVYAQIANGRLILTTEDGVSVSNTIVVEEDVWDNLMAYMENQ